MKIHYLMIRKAKFKKLKKLKRGDLQKRFNNLDN